MSQITLRDLPPHLEKQIRLLAKENRRSINKTIIELLSASLGVEPHSAKERDLSDLAGRWGEEEAKEFDENTKIFNTIRKG
jgi:plasmid stability protein